MGIKGRLTSISFLIPYSPTPCCSLFRGIAFFFNVNLLKDLFQRMKSKKKSHKMKISVQKFLTNCQFFLSDGNFSISLNVYFGGTFGEFKASYETRA